MPCEVFITDANRTSCQFNHSESDLIAYSDGLACKFHLPLVDNNGNETVKAKWGQGELQAFNDDILERVRLRIMVMVKVKGARLSQDAEGTSDFSGVVFPGEINLSGKRLYSNFDQAVFHGKADFKTTVFNNESSFKGTIFHAEANFQQACFSHSISFRSAKFNGPCNFTGAKFQQNSYFDSAVFTKEINLLKATFQKDASFTGVSFERDVTFKNSYFHHGVDFQGAIFHKLAEFTDTRFLTCMKFVNTQFLLGASFDRVTFDRVTDKEHSYSFPSTDFSKSIFKKSVSFTNRTFSTTTSFEDCVFHIVPKFQGCKLHQGTIFPLERNFKDHSKSAAPSYRTLKLDMENSRARQEEAMFNALEQKCQVADPETPFMVKCFSRLYEFTSNYGQSLGRPILGMGIVSLIFFVWYLYLSTSSITEVIWKSLTELNWKFLTELNWKPLVSVIGFTIEQSVSPFKVWRLSNSDSLGWLCSSVDLVKLKIIATGHSLFFLAFFGLFILVLRWIFKRG